MTHADYLRVVASGQAVMHAEVLAIERSASRIHADFARAVEWLLQARMVHVSGVGKSGHVAAHIAAKLTSTGTPATFLHPTEAMHGDMGIVGEGDVVVLISRSGECEETLRLAGALEGHRLIAITGVLTSKLAKLCEVVLDCGAQEDACPHGLVPTCSTAASLAMGDALAVTVMAERGFSADDFRRTHPGGAIGARA